MLNAVIIILREVLEASLIISLLLATSVLCLFSRKWIVYALLFGFLGAIVYAWSTPLITDWFDGVGQELMNASLNFVQVLGLIGFMFWLALHTTSKSPQPAHSNVINLPQYFMLVTVAFAITREISEIFIYSYGFSYSNQELTPMLLGGSIGAGIGLSIGALIYYSLLQVDRRIAITIIKAAIILICAGLTSQAVQFLIQAGWLPSSNPIWDTSSLIEESSIIGQLLYVILGYEATPSLVQAAFYFSVVIMIPTFSWFLNQWSLSLRSMDNNIPKKSD